MADKIRIINVVPGGAMGIVDANLGDVGSDKVSTIMRFSPKTGTISLYEMMGKEKIRKIYSGEDLKVKDYTEKNTIKILSFVIHSIALRQLQLYCSRYNCIFDYERTGKGSMMDAFIESCCKAYLDTQSKVKVG